uniref:RRM domain-containing protein n=1 Tax=Romanomermis culicivorax TaxID=13658 RepID=A0A915I0J5_ROMCU
MSDNENDLSDMHVNENDDLLNEEIEAGGDGDEEIDAASDASLDIIKAKFKEMQDEAEKIRQMQTDMAKEMNISTTSSSGGGNSNQQLNLSVEEKMEIDSRSIYVGNVDYGATAEELEAHFHGCGSVNRVTIQIDKYSGQPKGFAYIEFADKDSVQTAIALDDSLFRGRQIKRAECDADFERSLDLTVIV